MDKVVKMVLTVGGLCLFAQADAVWEAGSAPEIANGETVVISETEPPVVHFTDNGELRVAAGGTVTVTGTVASVVGSGTGETGVLALEDGGSLLNTTNSHLRVGYLGGQGTLTVAAGATLDMPLGDLRIAANEDGQRDAPSAGSVSVAGAVRVSKVEMNAYFPNTAGDKPTAVSAVLTLEEGGLLETGEIQKNDEALAVLYFDGGTLRARKATATFFSGGGWMDIVIADGKQAKIDTAGYDVTIPIYNTAKAAYLMIRDEDTAAGGGGLVKSGAGTLRFSLPAGQMAFTGPIVVEAGTLDLGVALAANQTVAVHEGADFVVYDPADLARITFLDQDAELKTYAVMADTANLNLVAINDIYHDDRLASPPTGRATATLSEPLTHAATVGTVDSPFLLLGYGGQLNLTNTGLEAEAVLVDGAGTFNFLGDRTYTAADAGRITLANSGTYRQDGRFVLSDTGEGTPATYTVTGGTLSAGGVMTVGGTGGAGELSVAADGTVWAGGLVVGDGGTGTVTLPAGAINATSGSASVFGMEGGAGTLTQTGGTLQMGETRIGGNTNSTGVLAISGGTATLSGLVSVGIDGGSGRLEVSGGSLTVNAEMRVAGNSSGNRAAETRGFVSVSNATLTANVVKFAPNAPNNGSMKEVETGRIELLEGGVFHIDQLYRNDDPLMSIWFDGGMIRVKAPVANQSFLHVAQTGTMQAMAAAGRYMTFDTAGVNAIIYKHEGTLKFTGAGGLKKIGAGVLTFEGSVVDYLGDTVVEAGTLQLRSGNQIPDGSGKGNLVVAEGAFFDLNGKAEQINQLAGAGTVMNSAAAAGVLGVLADGADQVWTDGQKIRGNVTLQKVGAGTLTLANGAVFGEGAQLLVSTGTARITQTDGFTHYRMKVDRIRNASTGISTQLSEIKFYEDGVDVTQSKVEVLFDPTGGIGTSATADVSAWPQNEQPPKAFDGETGTKWLDFRSHPNHKVGGMEMVWVGVRFPKVQRLTSYNWATANDSPERSPVDWRLQGSHDGVNWVDVDVQTGFDPTRSYFTFVMPDYGFAIDTTNTPQPFSPDSRVVVATGATLALDGASCVLGGIGGGGDVTLNGGDLCLTLSGGSPSFAGTVSGDGALVKQGEGIFYLENTGSLEGEVRLEAGTLSIAVPDKWFRFTIKKHRDDKTVTQFSELALYDVSGNRVNLGLEMGTLATLQPGECAPAGNYGTGGGETLDKLFDNATAGKSKWCLTGNTPAVDNPSTHRTAVMRLSASAGEVVSYDLCTAGDESGRDPVVWTLESSPDGVNWKVIDERADVNPPTARETWYVSGTGYAVGLARAVTGEGTSDALRDAVVSVGEDAALVLGGVAAPVGGLRVDMEGAGTVDNLTLAEGGALYLDNVTGNLKTLDIPLTVAALANPDMLKTWSLYVNGVLTKGYTLQWDPETGRFALRMGGTVMLVL